MTYLAACIFWFFALAGCKDVWQLMAVTAFDVGLLVFVERMLP